MVSPKLVRAAFLCQYVQELIRNPFHTSTVASVVIQATNMPSHVGRG